MSEEKDPRELTTDEKLSLRKEALRRILNEDEDLSTDFMLRAQAHPAD
jgi:hypothetical protein